MNPSEILACVAILFTFASPLNAEKPTGPVYQHLKGLEPFVGEWEGKMDPPGEVPVGVCRVSCQWVNFKSYLHMNVTFSPDGSGIVLDPMHNVIGYSGETKTAYGWDFRITTPLMGVVEITEKRMVQNYEGVDFEGKPHSRTTTYELRTPDELVVTNTNIKRGGESKSDEPIITLRRVKP